MNPEELLLQRGLAQAVQSGQVKSRSDAVAWLRSKGYDENGKKIEQPGFFESVGDAAMDATRQFGRGLAESGYGTGQGIANLFYGADSPQAESVRQGRQGMREYYGDAEGLSGDVTGILGNLLGTGAQFMVPGAVVGRAGQAAGALSRVPALARAAPALETAGNVMSKIAAPIAGTSARARAARVGSGAVLNAPLNIAMAQSPEDSLAGTIGYLADSPVWREVANDPFLSTGVETLGDLLAGGVFEGAGASVRRFAESDMGKRIGEMFRRTPTTTPPAAIVPGQIPGGAMATAPLPPTLNVPPSRTTPTMRPRSTTRLKTPGQMSYEDVQRIFTGAVPEVVEEAPIRRTLGPRSGPSILDPEEFGALPGVAERPSMLQRAIESPYRNALGAALGVTGVGLGMSRMGAREPQTPEEDGLAPRQANLGPLAGLAIAGAAMFGGSAAARGALRTAERAAVTNAAEGFVGKLYSRMENAIATFPQEVASGKEWASRLSDNVNSSELRWTGLDQFLADNADRAVTKDEIAQYARANPVEIEEIVNAGPDARYGPGGRIDATPNIPGKKNYREVLFQFVPKQGARGSGSGRGEYLSQHWSVEDNLMHLRMFDVDLPNGERGLVVSEIQSDLHQDARKVAKAIEELDPERRKKVYGEGGEYITREQQEALDRIDQLRAQVNAMNDVDFVRYTQTAVAPALERVGIPSEYVGNIQKAFNKVVDSEDLLNAYMYAEDAITAALGKKKLPKAAESALDDLVKAAMLDNNLDNGNVFADLMDYVPIAEGRVSDPFYKAVDSFDPVASRRDLMKRVVGFTEDNAEQLAKLQQEYKETRQLYESKYGSRGASLQRIPEAPFAKTQEWVELGIRRALHEAAQGGYDRIIFSNGAQAGRANKYVNTFVAHSVELMPAPKPPKGAYSSGNKHVNLTAFDEGGKKLLLSPGISGTFLNQPPAHTVRLEYNGTDKDLFKKVSEYLPKDKAAEAIAKFGTRVYGETPVGAVGMLGFYDNMVPQVLKKTTRLPIEMVNLKPNEVGLAAADNISVKLTPEIRVAIASGQRLLAPALLAGGAAALAPSTAEAQDGTPDDGGLGIGGMLAVGAAALGLYKVRGKWTAAKAALEHARANPNRVNLARIAEDAFKANKMELRGQQTLEQTARNAERIRNPVSPYSADAYANPTMPEHVFQMAGRILTDPASADEIATATKELVDSGRLELGGRIPWDTEKKLAAELGVRIEDLATRDPARKLSAPEILALRSVYYRDLRRKQLVKQVMNGGAQYTAEERELAAALYNALDNRSQNQLQRILRDVGQTGRDLNSMKIVVKESSDPTDWLWRAQKLAGGRELTDEVVQDILAAGNRQDWVKMELALGKARRLNKGFVDKFNDWWQSALLASIARPLRDLIGNSVNSVDTAAKHVLAGQIDKVLVGLGAFDTRVSGSVGPVRIAKVATDGARRGVQQAMAIIKGGASTPEEMAALERAARRYDFSNESAFDNPLLRAYSTFIRRTIGAADQPFYEMSFAMALESMARAIGQNNGLKGIELDQFVSGRVANPSPEMLRVAMEEALEGVWQNETALGKVGAAIQGGPGAGAVHRIVGKQILPFSSTPSAFTTQTLESNPFGLIGAAPDALAAAAGVTASQRKLVRKLAKAGTGTAWIVLGYMLADADKLTTSYPQDEGEKALWSETGRQPNSLLVYGKYIPLSGMLGPQAQLMGIGAYLRKSFEERETGALQAIAEAGTAGVAKTLQDSPVMQGVKHTTEIMEAAGTDDRNKRAELLSNVLQSQVSGMVPRFIQQTAQAFDTDAAGDVIMRDPTAETGLMADIGGSLQQTIPGMRSDLPVKVSPFGRTRTSGMGGMAAVLSPVRPYESYNTPLTMALEEAGAFPSTPRRKRDEESVQMYNLKRMVQGPEEESFLMRLLGGDPSVMTYVSAEAEDEYNQTGDIAVLVASALKNFRSEQSRALREAGGIP